MFVSSPLVMFFHSVSFAPLFLLLILGSQGIYQMTIQVIEFDTLVDTMLTLQDLE